MKNILLLIALLIFCVAGTVMFCLGDTISGIIITTIFLFTALLLYKNVLWSKRYNS